MDFAQLPGALREADRLPSYFEAMTQTPLQSSPGG
jgi:hypothetical protein